jgi:hypothetical protein
MRRIHSLLFGLAALGPLLASATHAAIIVEYDLTGLATTPEPATASPTTVDPNVSGLLLTRGAGLGPAGLTNGYSADEFSVGAAGDSLAEAVAAGDYFQWGFTTNANTLTSLTQLGFSMRRSAVDAPSNFEVQASLDGFATPGTPVASFTYLGRSSGTAPGVVAPFQWMTTDTPGQNAGNQILPAALLLADDLVLQALPGGTTVTFRMFGWGNGNVAVTNTVALGRFDGPTVEGVVIPIPEPASLALVGSALAFACAARRRP